MTKGTLKIHTQNILPIIKKWLYSDKDIFLRELVSNACDALSKTRILRDQKALEALDTELCVEITVDPKAQTLTISDTGIGMTSDEVEKYIAQVAFSGAEEFISKYQSQNESDQIIGHFGLGFYSAYMVSSKVELETKSYLAEESAVLWTCDGSSEYDIVPTSRTSRGTTITLFIDKESQEYLEESRLRQILEQYCAFLPFPISLNGQRINEKEPLWMKPPSQCTEADYLEFYQTLYPFQSDPIFWVHINVDYPFHLKGILYFPKLHRRFDWKECSIKLFCNRVFVSDHCKDLIPDYLTVLRGALDSPDIPLNVSRSHLQMDKTVRQLSSHICKKVADRLATLYETQREEFLRIWPDVELVVKLGVLQDDKFYERCQDFLVWKNLSGEWVTIAQYRDKHPDKIFYVADEKQSAHFLELYKNQSIDVLIANSAVDTPLMSFLESKLSPLKFQRIDGALDPSLLDTTKEKTLLDASGKTEAVKIADFFRGCLDSTSMAIDAKSLSSASLPAFLMVDEQTRRLRETMALTQQTLPGDKKNSSTFVVNTNSPLVNAAYKLSSKKPELAKDLALQIYELSLLSQKELDPNLLPDFVARTGRLLENLLETTSQEV